VITRSAESVGEDALGVSPAEFERLEGEGAFALSWRANGLAYGIPREIDDWLSAGQDVLINGSRGHLEVARQRYPQLLAILLQVDEAVLRQRLLARGRETPEQIEQRLARSRSFAPVGGASAATVAATTAGMQEVERSRMPEPKAPPTGKFLAILDNSGPLPQTVSRLLHLLDEARQCA